MFLSPELFDTNRNSVIKKAHESDSDVQAKNMLDYWGENFAGRASCRCLVTALCKSGKRATAVCVFGDLLVDFIQPQLPAGR